jgi:hypothetical protein
MLVDFADAIGIEVMEDEWPFICPAEPSELTCELIVAYLRVFRSVLTTESTAQKFPAR